MEFTYHADTFGTSGTGSTCDKASVVIVKAKVFLSNVDEFILHLMLPLLLQNRAEPEPYSHIN